MNSGETAELIEMMFVLIGWMGRRNHVLDGGPDRHRESDKFGGQWGAAM